MPTKKKSRKKGWIAWVVILVVVAVVIGASIIFKPDNTLAAAYESKAAFTGDIVLTVNGSGAIESHDDDTIYVKYASEVKEVVAENGDILKQGDIIVVLESDTLDDAIKAQRSAISSQESSIKRMRVMGSTHVRTVAEGRIKEVYVEEDDNIDNAMSIYGALVVISTDDMLKAVVKVPNTANYNIGNEVVVMVGDDKEMAEVKEINKLSSEITIVFEDDEDEDFEIGDMVVLEDSNGAIVGEGQLEINHPVYLTAVGGTVDNVRVELNDWVSRNETVLTRDGDIYDKDYIYAIDELQAMSTDLAEMEAAKEALVVRATMDGVINELNINEGQYLQQGQVICQVEGNAKLKILVEIDELDIAKIRVGQEADVNIDALEDIEYTANVAEINPLGVSVNNVTNYMITLQLPAHPEILLGMSAEVDIFAQESKDAVLIPITAVQIISNEHYVMMASEIGVMDIATHKVTIGLTDGVNVEIVEGLDAGDEVAVPREISDTMRMMMGGPPQSSEGTNFAEGN